MEHFFQTKKNPDPKSKGLPEDYPIPNNPNILFFIQRNENSDTVVYEPNILENGNIDENFPVKIYWIQYSEGGEIRSLNYIQNKLAYGYESVKVAQDKFEINFVSYKKLILTLELIDGKYKLYCKINNQISYLQNVYVYAESLGVFPNVKFIELYGQDVVSDLYSFEKLTIQK